MVISTLAISVKKLKNLSKGQFIKIRKLTLGLKMKFLKFSGIQP